jgi:hypothetical protein
MSRPGGSAPGCDLTCRQRDRQNSAVIPLFGRLIRLFGCEIPLFGRVANFASDSNGINYLQGGIWPAKDQNRRFSLFLPVEQRNRVTLRFAPPAQQQVEGARAPMARLCRRDRQDLPPQPGLFEPPRNRALQNAGPVGVQTPTGDDQDAAKSRVARCVNKCSDGAMRFGLGHAVQVEAGFDPMVAALQPLGVGAVDPREPIERGMPQRHIRLARLNRYRGRC